MYLIQKGGPMKTENFDGELHFLFERKKNLPKESGRVILIKVLHIKIFSVSFRRNIIS